MQTELNFTKNPQTNKWETTFTANEDFGLHLVFSDVMTIKLKQSCVNDGNYADTREGERVGIVGPYDETFHDTVYPKYIKLICSKPVAKGYMVTSD